MVTEVLPTNPHLSRVTSEELVLIETYLHRRVDLDLPRRLEATQKKVSGSPQNLPSYWIWQHAGNFYSPGHR
jgi:hypothetical protein